MPGVNIHAEVTEIGGEKDLELGLQKLSTQRFCGWSGRVPCFRFARNSR